MIVKMIVLFALMLFSLSGVLLYAQKTGDTIVPSYFNLTTSNGLIVAVYDTKKSSVEYIFPHIFTAYDSALYVLPFAGNLKLKSPELSTQTAYLENTHIITAVYNDFTVNYFSSFTNEDKVFYVVIKGEKEKIETLSFDFENGNGKLLTGISLLTYSHEDLTVHMTGNLIAGSLLRRYDDNIYEKYFLFSFTDSLHTDTSIVAKAINNINNAQTSLLDQEIHYMKTLFSKCKIPQNVSSKERDM